jgi:hypothetical protein
VSAGAGLERLVDAIAPYWEAEAEVCRTYFASPARTPRSDCAWIARQAAKELVDGVEPRLADLDQALRPSEGATDVRLVTRLAEELHEEAVHCVAFVEAYDRIRGLAPEGDVPALDGETLRREVAWPENIALRDLRAAHRRDHGSLGSLAGLVTEGGYCTLFTEGVALKGNGGADDAIAAACALVLEDEYEHMVTGIIGLRDAGLAASDWSLLVDLTVAQSRQRVLMRQAQFGHPVDATRLEVLLIGGAGPLAFDWERVPA